MNLSFGNILRCLIKESPSNWNLILAQAKFTYKNFVNKSTKKSPFEIVNGMSPRGTTKLRKLDVKIKNKAKFWGFVNFMKNLQEEVKSNLHEHNQVYKDRKDKIIKHENF